mgnify:CR=1 FL=1
MILEGKVALVTGASRGIGESIAMALASAGADVAFCYRQNEERAKQVALGIEATGRKVLALRCDVSKTAAVDAMMGKVLDEFGTIDVLVNNAGIIQDNLLIRMSEDQWDVVLSTNLKGVYNCTKGIARAMIRQRSGCIVNVTSVIGLTGNAGQANYAAAKAGIVGFTKSIAKELGGRGITVNAVMPGQVATEGTLEYNAQEMFDRTMQNQAIKQRVEPHHLAALIAFLASDDAAMISGQSIVCDGGGLLH